MTMDEYDVNKCEAKAKQNPMAKWWLTMSDSGIEVESCRNVPVNVRVAAPAPSEEPQTWLSLSNVLDQVEAELNGCRPRHVGSDT